ncbi:MAG: HEAT repeat domain-containing protein [Gemmatimonadota bacterium]|nr:MAG: HEAT repeat domain-containing protein [Gemmatimonadota bacterium]
MTTLASLSLPFALQLGTDILLKGTVVLAVAGLMTTLLNRSSAASRHAVWSIALGALLVLPVLSVSLPSWKVESLPSKQQVTALAETPLVAVDLPAAVRVAPGVIEGSQQRNRSAVSTGRVAEPAAPGFSISLSDVAAAALVMWAVVAATLLLRLALGAAQVACLTRRAMASDQGLLYTTESGPSWRNLIERPLRVVSSDEVTTPMSWGLLRPVLLFPKEAADWSAERRRVVLLHELAHVTRWDYLVHLMIEIVRSLYWPNPLVWVAARRATLERERACDDYALRVGMRSDVYATHLVEIARAQLAGGTPAGALPMAARSSLAQRVASILARGKSRGPASRKGMLTTGSLAVAVTLPLAAIELGAEHSSTMAYSWHDQQGPASVAERIEQLQDGDSRVRRYAAWALGELEDSRGVGPLVNALRDPDADVRQVAAWALGEIKDHRAIDPLIEVLADDDPIVREMAALALGEIEHRSAVRPLIEALERDDALRDPVIWALGEIGGREAESARDEVFRAWNRRAWENTEVFAGEWHGWRGSAPTHDIDRLMDDLTSSDADTRQEAAWKLGLLGDEQAVEYLLNALRDPDPAVRAMAIWALDETNPSRERRARA